jgi:hypothetical protein
MSDVEKYVEEQITKTASSQISADSPQSTSSAVDYRTVAKHPFLDMWFNGTGGFSGLTKGVDEDDNYNKSFVHVKPTERFYENRVAQGQYINEAKPYISSLIDPIFSANVEYNTDNEGFLSFIKNANRNGTSLNDVKRAAGKSAALHDDSFLIVDSAPETERVFLSYKGASDVVYIKCDNSTGELEAIAFVEPKNEDTGAARRLMYVAGFVLLQQQKGDEWEILKESETGIDKLNVSPMFYTPTPEGEYISKNPEQYGIACLAANLYNADVRVNWVETVQGHGTLVITGVRDMKGVPDATSNGLVLYSTEGQTPDAKFIHLEANVLDSIMASTKDKRAILHFLMGTKGVDLVQKQSGESGIAKAYEYLATNDTLLNGVKMFQTADEWIIEMFKLFTSDVTGFDVEVSYPSDFYPTTALTVDELIEAGKFTVQFGLEENTKQVFRNLASLISRGQSYERKKELIEEIDKNTFLQYAEKDSVLD